MVSELQNSKATIIEHNGKFVGAVLTHKDTGAKVYSLKSLYGLHTQVGKTVRLDNAFIGATGHIYAIHGREVKVVDANTLTLQDRKVLGIP